MLSADIRPSVRLSVTFVYCIQTAADIVKLLSRPGSPTILVFMTPSADTQFQGESLQWGIKYTEGGENLRFSDLVNSGVPALPNFGGSLLFAFGRVRRAVCQQQLSFC